MTKCGSAQWREGAENLIQIIYIFLISTCQLPSSSDSKMSITRTYDFAGEAIR